MANFFEIKDDSILLNIRLTPNARQEEFGGVIFDEKDTAWLKASVRAVPENGKANKALIAFVAKRFKIPKSTIEIVSGNQTRIKKLSIEGKKKELLALLYGLK